MKVTEAHVQAGARALRSARAPQANVDWMDNETLAAIVLRAAARVPRAKAQPSTEAPPPAASPSPTMGLELHEQKPLSQPDGLRKALEEIRDGYLVNHTSKWVNTKVRAALSTGER